MIAYYWPEARMHYLWSSLGAYGYADGLNASRAYSSLLCLIEMLGNDGCQRAHL